MGSGGEDLLPSYGFLQTSSSNKVADGMRILQDCRCDGYNRFVDWSIEAKTAQVTNESEIFDGFVPTMVRWCKRCDRNEENGENNSFEPLSVEKLFFLKQNLMRNAVGGRSWHQVGPS